MHPWNLTIDEARAVQERLAKSVITADRFGDIDTVAGTDVGFEAGGKITRAAVALLSYPDLQLQEYAVRRRDTEFPYVPGFLSFRECPALLDALAALSRPPDLLLCDGQGIAHPRRFGLACHLGVLTGIATIGVAKSRLIGSFGEVGPNRGARQPLVDRGETIGAVLRTRDNVKPLFISPGHNISLNSAVEIVLSCTPRYRLPETTRWADGLASQRPATLRRLAELEQSGLSPAR